MAEEPTANQPPTHSLPGASRTPDGYDVLILDAGTRQSLASARSLGRAGLRVALAECFAECDPALPVLAFRSRYCARSVVLPSFATDAPGFSAAIIEFVRAHPTRVIMPASDGAIAALMPWRGRLAALGCQLALAPNAVLEVANSKARILEVAHGLGVEGPRWSGSTSPPSWPPRWPGSGCRACSSPGRLAGRGPGPAAGHRGDQRDRGAPEGPRVPGRGRPGAGPANC